MTDCRLMPVSFQVWDDAMICHDDATEMAMVCQKSLEAIWWMVATPNHVFDMHGRHLKKTGIYSVYGATSYVDMREKIDVYEPGIRIMCAAHLSKWSTTHNLFGHVWIALFRHDF